MNPGSTFCGVCGNRLAESHSQYQQAAGIQIDADSRGQGRGYEWEVRLLIQTRNLAALAGLLKPFFPSQGSGGGGFNINLGG